MIRQPSDNQNDTGKKTDTDSIRHINRSAAGPRPPMPRSPFNIPDMPMAANLSLPLQEPADEKKEASNSTVADEQ